MLLVLLVYGGRGDSSTSKIPVNFAVTRLQNLVGLYVTTVFIVKGGGRVLSAGLQLGNNNKN